MKKLMLMVAAATFVLTSCGNKTNANAEECDSTCTEAVECEGGCPVKAANEALSAALESGDAETISNALKETVAAAEKLAKEGKDKAVNELVSSVQNFITTNEQKLQEVGVIDAVKSIPAQIEETANAAAAAAKAEAEAVKGQAEAAAEQAVEDAKAKANEKVDEAATKAAEKVDEAATKAAEKTDAAISDAASKAKGKLGL